jgi:hypothetical protein
MPDFYAPGEYDLAGTVVGVVEEGRVLDGSRIRAGDAVIALASSGLHTNGYSLARRIVFERMGLGGGRSVPRARTARWPTCCSACTAPTCRAIGRLLERTGRSTGWRTSPAAGWSTTSRASSRGAGRAHRAASWEVPRLPVLQREGGEDAEMEERRCSAPSTWASGWSRWSLVGVGYDRFGGSGSYVVRTPSAQVGLPDQLYGSGPHELREPRWSAFVGAAQTRLLTTLAVEAGWMQGGSALAGYEQLRAAYDPGRGTFFGSIGGRIAF